MGMTDYALYLVTVQDDHTKDVEVLYKGTESTCTDYKEWFERDNKYPGKFLQVLPWRAAYKERVAHGVGFENDLQGNIHHLVNPIIGMLRIREQDEHTEYYVSRLRAVLALADEYFGKYEEQREFEKWLAERNQGEK